MLEFHRHPRSPRAKSAIGSPHTHPDPYQSIVLVAPIPAPATVAEVAGSSAAVPVADVGAVVVHVVDPDLDVCLELAETSERPRGCPRKKAGESNPKGLHMSMSMSM